MFITSTWLFQGLKKVLTFMATAITLLRLKGSGLSCLVLEEECDREPCR